MKEKRKKYECEALLKEHFNLTDEDLSYLWELFMEYGMTRGEAPHRTRGNHYFLQGICEHIVVEWKEWNKKLSPELKKIITEKYPQLMTNHTDFEWT